MLFKITKGVNGKQAYTSIVRPTMEYASPCWDPFEQGHIDKLEQVQNKAVRFIKSDYKWTSSVSSMKSELGLETLQKEDLSRETACFIKH